MQKLKKICKEKGLNYSFASRVIIVNHELKNLYKKGELMELEIELDQDIYCYIDAYKKTLKVDPSAVVTVAIEEYLETTEDSPLSRSKPRTSSRRRKRRKSGYSKKSGKKN